VFDKDAGSNLSIPPEILAFVHDKEQISAFIETLLNDINIKYDHSGDTQTGLDFKKLMQNLFNFSHKSQYIPSGSGDFMISYGQFFFTLFRHFDGISTEASLLIVRSSTI
jgi:hypothetical protein